jgi:hypothetical protein
VEVVAGCGEFLRDLRHQVGRTLEIIRSAAGNQGIANILDRSRCEVDSGSFII